MYLRFYGRLLAADNSLLYAAPYPLDSGNLSLFLAALAADMTPETSLLVNSFIVSDVFINRFARLNSTARNADDIGKIFHQQSDDTYWKLTAIGPPLTYDAFAPVPPALTGAPASGGGGSSPAAAQFGVTASYPGDGNYHFVFHVPAANTYDGIGLFRAGSPAYGPAQLNAASSSANLFNNAPVDGLLFQDQNAFPPSTDLYYSAVAFKGGSIVATGVEVHVRGGVIL